MHASDEHLCLQGSYDSDIKCFGEIALSGESSIDDGSPQSPANASQTRIELPEAEAEAIYDSNKLADVSSEQLQSSHGRTIAL